MSGGTPPGRLSIIVPVYNERDTIATVLERIRAVSLPGGLEREIVVVDDGSSDGTREVLAGTAGEGCRIVLHPENRGKGAAVRTGIAAGHRGSPPHPGCRPRIRPRRLSAPPRPRPRRCARGLWLPLPERRPPPHVADRRRRQPLSDRHDPRPLRARAQRHGDLLQAGAGRRAEGDAAPRLRLRYRAGDHDQAREARGADPRSAIRYYGRTRAEGKKIGWRDGAAALWTLLKFRFVD